MNAKIATADRLFTKPSFRRKPESRLSAPPLDSGFRRNDDL